MKRKIEKLILAVFFLNPFSLFPSEEIVDEAGVSVDGEAFKANKYIGLGVLTITNSSSNAVKGSCEKLPKSVVFPLNVSIETASSMVSHIGGSGSLTVKSGTSLITNLLPKGSVIVDGNLVYTGENRSSFSNVSGSGVLSTFQNDITVDSANNIYQWNVFFQTVTSLKLPLTTILSKDSNLVTTSNVGSLSAPLCVTGLGQWTISSGKTATARRIPANQLILGRVFT